MTDAKNATITLHFALPEEQTEMRTVVYAGRAQSAISAALHSIRNWLKYSELTREESARLEEIRATLLDGVVEP